MKTLQEYLTTQMDLIDFFGDPIEGERDETQSYLKELQALQRTKLRFDKLVDMVVSDNAGDGLPQDKTNLIEALDHYINE